MVIGKGALLVTGAVLGTGILGAKIAHASEDHAHPPHYPWNHNGAAESFDAKSIRRGYQVYREVCSACHGMEYVAFRHLGEIAFTAKEVKRYADETEVWTEPDENNEIHKRPAKSFDYFPSPYRNKLEARAANGGALPPDLSGIVKARPGGEDYVFALLTGYDNPPAGVELREGLYYNPYFPGGAIGMAPPLADGSVDFVDGTPATLSQMAKDVSTFLAWTSRMEQDTRKQFGIKATVGTVIVAAAAWYWKRFKWSTVKNARIHYRD
ncbi:mitochondrial cytochrome c1 [Acrasis kona]|uniref:Mitochondrial cytochrome c1 n=1 Tax=Acrasis kona TaxID=1008807 RepID=A0AAW2ZBY8_9EUKA